MSISASKHCVMASLCGAFYLKVLLGVALCQPQHPIGSALNNTDTLETVFSDYFQWKLRTYPEWATETGFKGFNHLVEDYSFEAVEAKEANCRKFLERSSKLLPKNENEKIYQKIFQVNSIFSFSSFFKCNLCLFPLSMNNYK